MKIVLARSGELDGSGITRVMVSWAQILFRAGHEVTILAQESGHDSPFAPIPGVSREFYSAPATRSRVSRLIGGRASAVRAVLRRWETCPPDLLISHDSLLTVGVRRGLPDATILQTFHSPFVDENRLGNWLYAPSLGRRMTYPATLAVAWHADRAALRAASHAHTLSDFTWDRLSRRYPGPCRRIPWTRIPGTFDHERFVPVRDRGEIRRMLDLPERLRVLLTIRRLVPRNGVDRIVKCATELLEDGAGDFLFLIGGTGELLESLKREAMEAGVSDHVRFLGFVPENRLAAYYQAADAFLLPTRDLECFGLPVIEAMACGSVPLVMPDGGPAEICRPFPACVAEKNSDTAFVRLVRAYISGAAAGVIDGLADHATTHYSEDAVRDRVEGLVCRVAGREA